MEKIISLYRDDHLSVSKVGARLESDGYPMSDGVIYSILRTAGVPRRSPSGMPGPRAGAPGPEVWDLWQHGFSQREIAEMYGITRATVNIRIRDYRADQAAKGNPL